MQYLELGPVPADETCAQVGSKNYREVALAECRRYKQLLEAKFPEGRFAIKGFSHDYGTYHEVVIYYDDDNHDYVSMVEENLPATWNDSAILAAVCNTGNFDHFKGYSY
jgi:hypothetical protein